MNTVAAHIRSIIESDGPISIAEFMRIALTGRADSYYMRSDPIGLYGDFITAPEISQVFGECIGLWCVDVWSKLGSPAAFTLVELGPGRGTLMRDVLRAARVAPDFLTAATVALVEVSPALRNVQAALLRADGLPTVRWYNGFQDIDVIGPLIVIANEFFDALPVVQFVKGHEGWALRTVGLNDAGELMLGTQPDAQASVCVPVSLLDAPFGSTFEHSIERENVARAIARVIQNEGGGTLVFDYGFEGPALGDTLQAVKGHRYAGILMEPGMADLTSHVDFTALAEAFAGGGACVSKISTQAGFLTQLGAVERTQILKRLASEQQKAQLESALKRLTSADAMGTLFKVLCAVSSQAIQPAGFEAE